MEPSSIIEAYFSKISDPLLIKQNKHGLRHSKNAYLNRDYFEYSLYIIFNTSLVGIQNGLYGCLYKKNQKCRSDRKIG